MDTGLRRNPFSSDRVDPQCGGYIFTDGGSLAQVVGSLQHAGWRGRLVGPHGAGKSTLLADIIAAIPPQDGTVAQWHCSDTRRGLSRYWLKDLRRAKVVTIDGAERLLPGLLWIVRFITRISGRGLIITAHNRRGPGCCVRVNPSAAALTQKVRSLAGGRIDLTEEVARFMARHQGNARETLFDLYLHMENAKGKFRRYGDSYRNCSR